MPRYRRRRNFRRRRPRRTNYTGALTNVARAVGIARAAYSGVRYLRGLVNSEMLHIDQTCQLGLNQSAIFSLCGIGQGDGISGRTGNSILAKSLTWNGYMYVNSAVTSNTRVMIALVLDKQQISDTTPTITDIFTSNASAHTLLNINNAGRFSILYRRQYTLTPSTGGKDAQQLKYHKKFQMHVRYNGGGSSDIQKNGLYLVYITSEPVNFPTIELITRFNYHDN